MDMKLSGSGVITAGDYEKVRICGSGKMDGLVRCDSLHISGSVNGCELQCREMRWKPAVLSLSSETAR